MDPQEPGICRLNLKVISISSGASICQKKKSGQRLSQPWGHEPQDNNLSQPWGHVPQDVGEHAVKKSAKQKITHYHSKLPMATAWRCILYSANSIKMICKVAWGGKRLVWEVQQADATESTNAASSPPYSDYARHTLCVLGSNNSGALMPGSTSCLRSSFTLAVQWL